MLENLKNKFILSLAVLCLIVTGLIVNVQIIKSSSGGSQLLIGDFFTNQEDIDVAGTPEQLPNLLIGKGLDVLIKAKLGNAGDIMLGASAADADKDSSVHLRLSAGRAVGFPVQNLNMIWVDADNNGDGIEYTIN